MRGFLVVLLGLGLACGPLQTYGQGIRTVCDAPSTCTDYRTASPELKMALLAACIDEQVWNHQARDVFAALAMAAPEVKGTLLRAAAEEGGVHECELADLLDTMYGQ